MYNRVRIDRPRDRFSPERDGRWGRQARRATARFGARRAPLRRRRRRGRRSDEAGRRVRPPRSQPRLAGCAARGHAHRAPGVVRRAPSRSPTRPISGPSASIAGVSPGVANLLFVSGEVGIGVGVILGGSRDSAPPVTPARPVTPWSIRPACLSVRGDRMCGRPRPARGLAAPSRRKCWWSGVVDRVIASPRPAARRCSRPRVGGWLARTRHRRPDQPVQPGTGRPRGMYARLHP